MPNLKVRDALLLLLLAAMVGCRAYPAMDLVELGPDYRGEAVWTLEYQFGELVRFNHQVTRGKRQLISEGVIERRADGIYVAASSNAGMTLYAVRLRGEQLEILKNTMRMPESILRRLILDDLLFFHRGQAWQPGKFYRSAVDNSIWAGNSHITGWYGRRDGNRWIAIRSEEGRMHYRASLEMRPDKNGADYPSRIEIDNWRDGYSASLAFVME